MDNGVVITIVGEHAGESLSQIFQRKKNDIDQYGYTYWLFKSHSARPEVVQQLAQKIKENLKCYFIHASTKSGARPTKQQEVSRSYSSDNITWKPIHSQMRVTGSSSSSFALVLKEIKLTESLIDLWDYSRYPDLDLPIKPRLGDSTIPAIEKYSGDHPGKVISHVREVVAIGELVFPFCVYLKNT